jgi:hypothetical protein
MSRWLHDDSCLYSSDDEEYHFEEPYHYQDKYLYDYQWYHENFPEEWAVNHKEGTGPGQCMNCADYGSINCVFIGYCANCAIHDYNGSRGRGFIDVGIESNHEDVQIIPSVFETYLKDIDIWVIHSVDSTDNDVNNLNNVEYPEEDDICEDYNHNGIMSPQFEGGYNDF